MKAKWRPAGTTVHTHINTHMGKTSAECFCVRSREHLKCDYYNYDDLYTVCIYSFMSLLLSKCSVIK